MHTDLEKAKGYLEKENCTCVLCKADSLYHSRYRGVRPLLDFLDSSVDFSGFSAADKVVGKATAFLYCLLKVRTVHAVVLSDAAAEVLTKAGIPFSCDTRVPFIRNRTNTGLCPMENATKDIDEPHLALAAIRETLHKLQNQAAQ
jgi:hypothetical protein